MSAKHLQKECLHADFELLEAPVGRIKCPFYAEADAMW
jgi:hypothetical protein